MVIPGCLRLSRQTGSGSEQQGLGFHSINLKYNNRVLLLYGTNQGRSAGHERLLHDSGSSPQLAAKSKSHTEKKRFPHLSKSYEGKLSPRNQARGPTSPRSAPAKRPWETIPWNTNRRRELSP